MPDADTTAIVMEHAHHHRLLSPDGMLIPVRPAWDASLFCGAESLAITQEEDESTHKQLESRGTGGDDRPAPLTKANQALIPQVASQSAFSSKGLVSKAFYADEQTLIFKADARTAMKWVAEAGVQVNCIVTSPPFYGQRDYEVEGQLGLEPHPSQFVAALVDVFECCREVLQPTGSLWVNLGDTYWSGKGQHRSDEKKQSARRFGLRPQDTKGDGLWARPKQLLLIPHRFAIAMQDTGWLVRNDNVWVKPNPIPDQVRDRCSTSHEYVFHFVQQRWYYFDRESVGRPTTRKTKLPPPDTWILPPSRGGNGHKARFSEALIRIPVRSTTPPNGIVLDPFAGSGTALAYARKLGLRSIGIDIKDEFCQMMVDAVRGIQAGPEQQRLLEQGEAYSFLGLDGEGLG